jgi:hypothetical protein
VTCSSFDEIFPTKYFATGVVFVNCRLPTAIIRDEVQHFTYATPPGLFLRLGVCYNNVILSGFKK